MAGSDVKTMSVVEMVQWTIRQCNSTRASTGDYPPGPLFTFLIGAGFSVSAGVPGTAHLVAALEEFDRKGEGDFGELLDETAGRTVAGSVEEIGQRYFSLMEKALQGPVARQAFITAAVQWAARKQVQMSMESVLLASMLLAGAGGVRDLPADSGDREWLPRRFARRAYTTNFDELIPTTFYLGNQPIDVVDGPIPRPVSESFPSLVYLHGRHLHYNLRNTAEELLRADATPNCPDLFGDFREALRHTGLIVIGYAGAEDLVMDGIREALHDQHSLLYGLWWCTHPGVEAIHPKAREMVQSSDRAHYLQPGGKADAVMESLSDEVRVGRFAAVSSWHRHADRTQKLLREWLAAQQVEVLEFIAEARALRGRYRGDRALALLGRREKVERVARAGGDRLYAEFLRGAAGVHYMAFQLGPACVAFEQSLQLSRKAGDNEGAAISTCGLGEVHAAAERRQKASVALREALELFSALGDEHGRANTLQALGSLELGAGDSTAARSAFQESMGICQQIGYDLGAANAHVGLGDLDVRSGRLQDARSHYQAALDFHDSVGDDFGAADALVSIGSLEVRAGELERGLALLGKALQLARRVGSETGVSRSLTAVAQAQMWSGNPEEAHKSVQEALAIDTKLAWDFGAASDRRLLGDLELRASHVAGARKLYERARKSRRKAAGEREDVGDLWGLACCAVADRDAGKAADLLSDARQSLAKSPDAEACWWLDMVEGQILGLRGEVIPAREVWVKAESEARAAGFNLVADELKREIEKLDEGEGTEAAQEVKD